MADLINPEADILLDPKTGIKDHSCPCSRNKSNYIHSVIEKVGNLIAQQFEADRSRRVKLGKYWGSLKAEAPCLSQEDETHLD